MTLVPPPDAAEGEAPRAGNFSPQPGSNPVSPSSLAISELGGELIDWLCHDSSPSDW
jgi:hypothetical protein